MGFPGVRFSFGRVALFTSAAFFALLFAACSSRDDVSRGAQLLLSTERLEAGSTFELRLDEEVATPANTASPLHITPPLKGRWAWVSARSGIFTPGEPMRLGTAYRFTLSAGLRDAQGRPVRARLQRTFRTPDFSVTVARVSGANATNASPLPGVLLELNAAVTPKDVERLAAFRSGTKRVPARLVEQDQIWAAGFYIPSSPTPGWRESFLSRASATSRSARSEPEPAAASTRFVLAPVAPLPAGEGWEFVLRSGLPSTETPARLAQATTLRIGGVRPFVLETARADNELNSGRTITLAFSRALERNVSATNLASWISVTPAVTNLLLSHRDSGLVLGGAFKLGTNYSVAIRAGLPDGRGVPLARSTNVTLTFKPMEPRLYFPAFDTAQLARGGRDFQLLAVNTRDVRLRGKLLDRHTLIHALRGYESYLSQRRGSEAGSVPAAIEYNLIPGRTIFATNFSAEHAVDTTHRIALPWDKLLRGRKFAAVFVAADFATRVDDGLRGTHPGPQALVQLTDLGLAWKSGSGARDEVVVWVFSHTTGAPVPGVTVRLVTDENETLAESRSDTGGVARLAGASGAEWLFAELGDDLHATRLDEPVSQLWSNGLPWQERGGSREAGDVLLFSDRSVYRPGETVHVKAIARARGDAGPDFPTNRTARLMAFDARGDVFLQTNLTFSARGSLDAAVKLPGSPRGQYRLALEQGDREHELDFQVRDFQPAAFEITMDARPTYAAGESISVPVSARYFHGAALGRASLKWNLDATDAGFVPDGWQDFQFLAAGASFGRPERERMQVDLHGEDTLRGATPVLIEPELSPNPRAPAPLRASLFAEITDLNQQTLARSAEFILHSSRFYLGMKRVAGVVPAGSPLPVALTAVRTDGTPESRPVTATLKLARVEWQSVRVLQAGQVIGYRSEPVITNLLSREVTTAPVRRVGTKWELDPAATPPALPAIAEPGEYILTATARDPDGREMLTEMTFHVIGAKQKLAWDFRNAATMEIVADRKHHRAGDTAVLLCKAPFAGEALVTIEREGVRRSFTTRLEGNAAAVRVPLLDSDSPNVFVSVLLVRGSDASPRKFPMPEHRLGACRLLVRRPADELTVNVSLDASDYRPVQKVRATAEVLDHNGQPVTGAEVTLYAVDEGVLSLGDDTTPDPLAFFNLPRALGVQTGISLPTLLPEDPELRVFHNKGRIGGGGGREEARKNFTPLAHWSPALVTDSAGKVTASFTAPDSLTRYKVFAIAHAGRAQFGSGESSFEVNKPLMIEPSLPRFANVGDRLRLRAVAHNRTGREADVEVSLQLDDKAVSAQSATLRRTVKVAAHSLAALDFPVELRETGGATWVWKARFAGDSSNGFTDSVQSTLAVGHPAPMLREILLARTGAAQSNLLAGANPRLLEGRGTVTVRVSNSRLSELAESASQLLHYPYGCVEQTTSALLPWLTLRDAPAAMPRPGSGATNAEAAIAAGVGRLLSMQTHDGGFSYWPGSREPMPWSSAWGGLGLVIAAEHGVEVPPRRMAELFKYLDAGLRDSARVSDGGDFSARCLALYTLARAGKAKSSYHEVLFNRRESLSIENRALLALAILHADGPRAMAAGLLATSAPARRGADEWFGCPERETAIRLLAWSRFDSKAAGTDRLAVELVRAQRNGHWGTTQGNAWALLALVDYAKRVEQDATAASGSLAWGSETRPFELVPHSVTELFFAASPDKRALPLLLVNPGRRTLYTQLALETRGTAPDAALDRGFLVHRAYERLDEDNQPQPATSFRVGDRVLVTLRVEARQAMSWVAFDDPLPAVFEVVTPEFKTERNTRNTVALSDGNFWSDHREMKHDRMQFFRNQLPAGSHEIRYIARVRAAGEVTAPATQVEAMYAPDRFGLSDAARVKAEAAE